MRRTLLLMLQLTFILLSDSVPCPAETAATLVVKTYNYAGVPAGTLAEAQDVATRVLKKAGIRLIWIACPVFESDIPQFPDCVRPHKRPEMILKLVRKFPPALAQPRDAFGFALIPATGFIAYDRIQRMRLEQHVSEELLLGHVAAHEIGHLMLGLDSHHDGIMAARWYASELHKAERGNLLFPPAQARLMRERITSQFRSNHAFAGALTP